jgi:hypothetical protein
MDLLHQPPDATALSEWTRVLDDGVRGDRVAPAITNSADYFTAVIEDLYQTYLRRAVDPTGMRDCLSFLTHGRSIGEVRAGILGSEEYFSRFGGGTGQTWETALYSDALGRAIDQTGQRYIDAALAAGVPRQQIALGVIFSDEFNQDVVNGWYEQFLGRAADPDALNAWSAYLAQYHLEQFVVSGIVGSAEYFARV